MGKTRDLFKKIRDIKGQFHAKMGSIRNRKPLQDSFIENPMNNMQDKNMTLKDELPMLLGAQYATGEE